jgi:hypothetical protein
MDRFQKMVGEPDRYGTVFRRTRMIVWRVDCSRQVSCEAATPSHFQSGALACAVPCRPPFPLRDVESWGLLRDTRASARSNTALPKRRKTQARVIIDWYDYTPIPVWYQVATGNLLGTEEISKSVWYQVAIGYQIETKMLSGWFQCRSGRKRKNSNAHHRFC